MLLVFVLTVAVLQASVSMAASPSPSPLLSQVCPDQSCRPITCVLVSVCLSDDGSYLPYKEEEQQAQSSSFNFTGDVLRIGAVNVRE